MTVDIDTLITPVTRDEMLATLLSLATTAGLDTTAWQPGQPGRTIIAIVSQAMADQSSLSVGVLARAGFLELAAEITPEGGPGWLDLLGETRFGVKRIAATQATTTETLTAAGAAGGTFQAGQLHFTTPDGILYSNTAAVVIPSTGTVNVEIAADVSGAASSAGAGTISALLTPMIGVTVTNAAAAVGSDAETNAAYILRCKSRLAALSADGPSGAYDFNARTINGDDQVKVSSGALTQPLSPVNRTREVVDPATGTVTTYVASATGAYATPPNYTQQLSQSIVSSTNATPIVVQVTGHGYVNGDQVYISGHLLNTPANGSWPITRIDSDHFSLNGSAGTAVGGATGQAYRYSDLDLIDKSIQANAVPLAVTARTVSAVAVGVSVTGVITVTGPAATRTDAQIIAAASTALADLAETIPIGGQGTSGLLYLETIRDAIYRATAGTVSVSLSVPSADVTVGTFGVVFFNTPSFTVVRV